MSDQTEKPGSDSDLLRMTTDVVTAYVGNNTVAPSELAEVIRTVHASLRQAQSGGDDAAAPPKPAVPIKKSITPDYLICLEDGRELKMLKRHLRTDLQPDPGRIPGEVGAGFRLPDGRTQLRPQALGVREADRPRPEAEEGGSRRRRRGTARERRHGGRRHLLGRYLIRLRRAHPSCGRSWSRERGRRTSGRPRPRSTPTARRRRTTCRSPCRTASRYS